MRWIYYLISIMSALAEYYALLERGASIPFLLGPAEKDA